MTERDYAALTALSLGQVGCSQFLKETEKPLPAGLPTGLNESQSGGPLGGDSPCVGKY